MTVSRIVSLPVMGTASSVHASRAALPSHLEGLMLTDAVWVHMTLSLKVTAPAKVGHSPRALTLGLLSVPLYPFRKWGGGQYLSFLELP